MIDVLIITFSENHYKNYMFYEILMKNVMKNVMNLYEIGSHRQKSPAICQTVGYIQNSMTNGSNGYLSNTLTLSSLMDITPIISLQRFG